MRRLSAISTTHRVVNLERGLFAPQAGINVKSREKSKVKIKVKHNGRIPS